MTKKEISAEFDIFIKEHTPDEFKFPSSISFLDIVEGKCATKRHINKHTWLNMEYTVNNWWMNGKSPMIESEILEYLDIEYVTHGSVIVHGWYGKRQDTGLLFNDLSLSNVFENMFDMSFKYNVIGVRQKPGRLEIWVKETKDHQSNITCEVIEKIAKCLEF